jgi:hypothetical protein
MKQAAPAIQNLARHLLALEANGTDQTEVGGGGTVSALTKLGLHLTKLVGANGYEALLARSLVLATMEAGWLRTVRVQADGTLVGFNEAAQQQVTQAGAKGGVALIAQLLDLLRIFIGEAVTMSIVRDIWPEVRRDDMDLSIQETPA